MKTAEQAVHDKLWKVLEPMVGGRIYEKRPMMEVEYPFADFEDFMTNFKGTKNGTLSQVEVSINIWDVECNRKNVSYTCNCLLHEAMMMSEAYGYRPSLRISESRFQILQDKTVTPALWRGIVKLIFDI